MIKDWNTAESPISWWRMGEQDIQEAQAPF